MNTNIYFEIQADDPQRAVNFYKGLFDWRFHRDENIPIEYWRIETSGSRGGILKRPVKTPPPGGTNAFVCSFQVENFDVIAEKILATGGIVAMEKFAVPGVCWQGYFLDPEGNTFGLFQVDPNAK